jgi:carboxypeptidase D
VDVKEHEAEFEIKAAIHGNEIGAWIVSMRFIDFLCSNYQTDPRATAILDTFELWVCPLHNVDGAYYGGLSSVSNAIRRNANNVDLNRNYTKVPGAGTSMTPEDETKVMMAFELEHNFVMNIDYHHGSETCIYPYSAVDYHTQDEAWWRIACRVYADTTQYYTTDNNYFDAYENGITSGRDWHTVVIGSTKDYFYYYQHVRGISLEIKNDDSPTGNALENLFQWNVYSIMAYMNQARMGIRGNVTDSITGEGLKAKVWVNDYDEDSSFVYSDSSGGHGNYYRPIIEGTYDVTYSCPGCEDKTVNNIQAKNYEATVVDVKLDCGSVNVNTHKNTVKENISITPNNKGVKISCKNAKSISMAAIYDMKGKLIKVFQLDAGNTSITWDGSDNSKKRISAGCYIIQVKTLKSNFNQPFIFSY